MRFDEAVHFLALLNTFGNWEIYPLRRSPGRQNLFKEYIVNCLKMCYTILIKYGVLPVPGPTAGLGAARIN